MISYLRRQLDESNEKLSKLRLAHEELIKERQMDRESSISANHFLGGLREQYSILRSRYQEQQQKLERLAALEAAEAMSISSALSAFQRRL